MNYLVVKSLCASLSLIFHKSFSISFHLGPDWVTHMVNARSCSHGSRFVLTGPTELFSRRRALCAPSARHSAHTCAETQLEPEAERGGPTEHRVPRRTRRGRRVHAKKRVQQSTSFKSHTDTDHNYTWCKHIKQHPRTVVQKEMRWPSRHLPPSRHDSAHGRTRSVSKLAARLYDALSVQVQMMHAPLLSSVLAPRRSTLAPSAYRLYHPLSLTSSSACSPGRWWHPPSACPRSRPPSPPPGS